MVGTFHWKSVVVNAKECVEESAYRLDPKRDREGLVGGQADVVIKRRDSALANLISLGRQDKCFSIRSAGHRPEYFHGQDKMVRCWVTWRVFSASTEHQPKDEKGVHVSWSHASFHGWS